MDSLDWNAEPDVDRLRILYGLLAQKPSEALPGLEELATEGSVASMLYLADFYMRGACSSRVDTNKARYWYTQAHKKGCPQASYMLGRILYQSREYELAFSAFLEGAEKGYLPAIYRLAKMYHHGEGVAKDISEYKRLLEAARSKGHIFAKRDLAALLITGKFGIASAGRGLMMLLSLWLDVGAIVGNAMRRGSTFDERVLA